MDPSDFDFYKEFLGVDTAKLEMISEMIGKTVALLMKGMVNGGLSEETALKVVNNTVKTILETVINEGRKK